MRRIVNLELDFDSGLFSEGRGGVAAPPRPTAPPPLLPASLRVRRRSRGFAAYSCFISGLLHSGFRAAQNDVRPMPARFPAVKIELFSPNQGCDAIQFRLIFGFASNNPLQVNRHEAPSSKSPTAHSPLPGPPGGAAVSRSGVAVLASAQTELRPAWHSAQHIDLISAVSTAVFQGTGLSLDDVDFVIDSGSDVLDGRSISNCGFLGAMGAHHKEESRVEEDGLWAAAYGAAKIAAGGASAGLIIAYSKPSESDPNLFYKSQVEPFYQRPVGFDHLAASGLQAQRYLAEHGTAAAALAGLVSRRWQDAATYGRVLVDAVPDAAAVLASANAAAPLRQLMMSRPVDGAVAVLLVSDEVALRCGRSAPRITGVGTSMDTHAFAARRAGRLEAAEVAARSAYRQAGWMRPAPSVAEVSGSSAVGELMVLEAAGLAAPGRALDLLSDSAAVAVNRSGGALPADPIMATGLVRLAEAARQLNHPERYGLGAPRTALVHGAGGVGMQSHCFMTLEV